jgi:hypothetical protein
MSAGCIIAVASMLAAKDELEGRTRRDVCQHEDDAEKRVELEWYVERTVEKHRRSMSKCVALFAKRGRA